MKTFLQWLVIIALFFGGGKLLVDSGKVSNLSEWFLALIVGILIGGIIDYYNRTH